VVIAGLSMGSGGWPLKVIRRLKMEHWLFVYVTVGLVIIPWTATLFFCPHSLEVLGRIDAALLIRSNLFAMGWGVANVLCAICCVRIGFALTGGILGGLGLSLGVTVPMIFKASGLFRSAPDIWSPAGRVVLVGTGLVLIAVWLVAVAGLGRERSLAKQQQGSSGLAGGLVMSAIAGVLSAGPVFAFAYSQGPILAELMRAGASETAAGFAVWAVGMPAGVLVNLGYAAYLMTRNGSWGCFRSGGREIILSAVTGIQFGMAFVLLGNGSLRLGVLGASVGWGMYQAMQVMGGQGVAIAWGEWRGVDRSSRLKMATAIALLLAGSAVLAWGNARNG